MFSPKRVYIITCDQFSYKIFIDLKASFINELMLKYVYLGEQIRANEYLNGTQVILKC